MKKFWRSGMIDKKVLRERERAEYINRLERTILELRRKAPEPEPLIRQSKRKTTRENINDWVFEQLRNRPRYDSDIEYDKTLNENRKAKGFKEV